MRGRRWLGTQGWGILCKSIGKYVMHLLLALSTLMARFNGSW